MSEALALEQTSGTEGNVAGRPGGGWLPGLAWLMAGGGLITAATQLSFDPGTLWHSGFYYGLAGFWSLVAAGGIAAVMGILGLLAWFRRCSTTLPSRVASLAVAAGLLVTVAEAMTYAVLPVDADARIAGPAPTPDDGVWRFALTGDTENRLDSAALVAGRIAAVHAERPIDGVFLLGDILSERGDFSEVIAKEFEAPFASVLEAGIPVYHTLGNHDVWTRLIPEMSNYERFHMGGHSYSTTTFGDGEVTFFRTNSQDLVDGPGQFLWLREALATHDSTWRIMIHHHPLYGYEDVYHEGDLRRYRILAPILYGDEPSVDLFFSGHNHYYERRRPINGVTYFTAGIGSRPSTMEALPEDDGRAAGRTRTPGFVLLSIRGNMLEIEAISVDGEVFDRHSITKNER